MRDFPPISALAQETIASEQLPSVPLSIPSPSPTRSAIPDAGLLLSRMREGDRNAAGEFVQAFGEQIRRRVRGKLGVGVRRIFDSQDIMATLSRRLDQFILRGRMDAVDAPQLWKLVFKIVDGAVVDKVRICRRLRSVEHDDSEFATNLLQRMREDDSRATDGTEQTIESALRCLKSDQDRELLVLWLNQTPHSRIADIMDCTPAAIRQRWCAIKAHLRANWQTET